MGFDWDKRKKGMETSVGALTFMLDDLHVRTLRLEGRDVEATEYETERGKYWAAKLAEEARPKPRRWPF